MSLVPGRVPYCFCYTLKQKSLVRRDPGERARGAFGPDHFSFGNDGLRSKRNSRVYVLVLGCPRKLVKGQKVGYNPNIPDLKL